MAKNMIPMPASKGFLPRVFGALVLVALVVIVVKYPGDAAGWMKDLFGLGEDAVEGLVSFVRTLGS